MIQQFHSSLNSSVNQNTTTRVTLFICFIILLILVYSIFWLPIVAKINREVNFYLYLKYFIGVNFFKNKKLDKTDNKNVGNYSFESYSIKS